VQANPPRFWVVLVLLSEAKRKRRDLSGIRSTVSASLGGRQHGVGAWWAQPRPAASWEPGEEELCPAQALAVGVS